MIINLYTTYDNIQILREGDTITAWTQHTAKSFDIGVSLDTKDYAFHKIDEGVFEVSKRH